MNKNMGSGFGSHNKVIPPKMSVGVGRGNGPGKGHWHWMASFSLLCCVPDMKLLVPEKGRKLSHLTYDPQTPKIAPWHLEGRCYALARGLAFRICVRDT